MSADNYLIRLYTFLPQVLIPGQSIQTATLTPSKTYYFFLHFPLFLLVISNILSTFETDRYPS